MKLIVTCEHGGNRIPALYTSLFSKHRKLLDSHRGYDPGALAVARDIQRAFFAELVYSTTSRLLVELNRSPGHRDAFSAVTRALSWDERQRLLARHYYPYRSAVASHIVAAIENSERILHISSHSFTPRLQGLERRADIGLLYDPRRANEQRVCLAWKKELERARPGLVVRRNYPYRGTADGLTTYLRRRFPERSYAGIELEVNQKYALGEPRSWATMRRLLLATLRRALADYAKNDY